MRTLGNILWFILGGFVSWLMWIILGIVYCVTLIGIPFGLQCFKVSGLSAFPFGKTVNHTEGGTGRVIGNIIWFIFGGLEMAIVEFLLGIVYCVTLIDIPFGLQHFKLAKISLAPFGVTVSKIAPTPVAEEAE